jgi:hypothetical protein|tara:strand:- start:37 stop:537 length:501 start_codon:yes stop_codon:yes gene_type:complete
MKKNILSLFLLIFCFVLNAQNAVNNVKPVSVEKAQENTVDAGIEFESKVVDYGVIEHNSDGQREFKFKSSGSDPLIIKSAKGSCGCTVPTWRKADGSATWQPGEDGSIGVKYATNRIGKFTKTITLSTNADKRPVILTIKGEVKAPAKDEGAMPVKKNDGSPLERK